MATEDDSDVPETGGVFTFGKSQFGDNSPNKFWIRDDRVTEVRCGDEHTVFIAESGRVFTFGINEWGQLGQTHNKICKKPTRIKALKSEKIKHLACGRSHTVLATESGKLYSFGANSEGQLGLGHTNNTASPTHIEGLELQQYKGLAAGADHSIALTDNGEVYVWGSNSDGQLGLGEEAESWQPVKLDIDDKVTHVTCGYYHTALVTEDGHLYTFGETEDGKLGQGEEPEDNKVPTKVRGIEGKVIQVSCGSKHTAVITDAGKLYTFGDGSNGQLGHGTTLLSSHKPSLLGWPKSKKIKNVSCGENHTAIITEKGQLFTFGDGRHGKLALGEENFANQFKPSLVSRFSNFIVQQVSCGGCHTLITVKPRLENGDVLTEEEEESEDDEFSYKNGELNGTLRSSMDLNGSISARNRRRDKLPDPGDTINRTLPPLNSMFSGRQLAPLSATLPSLGSRSLNRGKLPSLRQEAAPFTQPFPPPKKQEESEGEESGISENSGQDSDTLAIKRETLKVTKSSVPSAKPRPVPRAVDQLKDSDQEGSQDGSLHQEENEDILSDNEEEEKSKSIEATPVPALRRKQRATTSKVDSEDSGREEEEDSKESEGEKEDKKTKEKKSKKELKKGKKEKSKGGIFGRRKAVESDSEEEEKEDEDREDEKKKKNESGSEEEEEEKPRKKEIKKKKGEKPKKDKKKRIDKNKIKKDSEEEENSEEESEDNEEKKKPKTRKEAAKKKKMLKEESEEEDEVEEKPTPKKKRVAEKNKEESEKEEDYEEEEENDKKYEDEKVKKKDEEKPPEKKRSKACVIL